MFNPIHFISKKFKKHKFDKAEGQRTELDAYKMEYDQLKRERIGNRSESPHIQVAPVWLTSPERSKKSPKFEIKV